MKVFLSNAIYICIYIFYPFFDVFRSLFFDIFICLTFFCKPLTIMGTLFGQGVNLPYFADMFAKINCF